MRKFIRVLCFTFLPLGIIPTAGMADSTEPVKIALNNWSSQNISSYILGGVLERDGIEVEYIQADAMAQFAGLETGDITFQTEIWPTTMGARFQEALGTGDVLDMGPLGANAIEEWWYPTYVKEICPTLPDWKALLEPDCAKAFATPQTGDKGRYLGGAADWGGFDNERVEALGLPWKVIHAGSDIPLWAEVESAYKRKAPIMTWGYLPHWWPTKYEGEFVQFPEYTDECYKDASWGINPDAQYDCGKPHGILHKAASTAGEAKWPKAYAIMRNMQLNDEQYAALISRLELDGLPLQQVANEWLDANEAIWTKWK